MFQNLIPEGPNYAHHNTWGDHNGHSHLRSFLRPPSFCIPFNNKEPMLGTWQQIVFMEFDEKPRTREIICQLVG
jgi:secondary thiamine-phosphate synthase enzyme